MKLEDIIKTIRKVKNDRYPETGLICLENTFYGKTLSLEYCQNVKKIGDKYNVPVHLDGARMFNEVHALNVETPELTKHFDSLQFCLSKGKKKFLIHLLYTLVNIIIIIF